MTISRWNRALPIALVSCWSLTARAGEVVTSSAAADRVARLEAEVEAHPEDTDRRFQLAQAYAWSDRRAEARVEADRVWSEAPGYLDAQVLLARLDAWEEKWPEARARLDLVLKEAPGHHDALDLLASVELWSGALTESRAHLRALLEQQKTAELWYRLAQVESERLHSWAAYRATSEALALDPLHQKAKELRANIRLAQAEIALEMESLPAGAFGFSEITTVTALPRAFLSASIVHELRSRFSELNQRLGAQVDWRVHKDRTLSGFTAFGAPATSLPAFSIGARLTSEIWGPLDGSAQYVFDRLPDGSVLMRIGGLIGVRLARPLHAEAEYVFGLRIDAVGSEDLHSGALRLQYEPSESFRVLGAYGYGMELSRPTPLVDVLARKAHQIGAWGDGALGKGWSLRAGVMLELRDDATQVFRFVLALRKWV
ncbi:MAG: hypothetical protein IT384_31615 [Deltaproteobacteria bacterium]|nr:hypothetical protein [Deltaproteobacteria bacterium]